MQIDAVYHDIGVLESRYKRDTGRDTRDDFAVDRVDHQHRLGHDRLLQHRVADAEAVEHGKDIGAELDAVADDPELRRLFEHPHTPAFSPKRQRDRGSTEPAAHDENGIFSGCHQTSANQRSS
jgi:hypothetical protein